MFCPSQMKNYILTGLVSNFLMHLVTGWHLLCRKEITINWLIQPSGLQTQIYYTYASVFFFFQSSKHFSKALSLLSSQSQQKAFLSSVSSVLARGKSQRVPSPVNMVVEAWLQFRFLAKNLSTSIDVCELVRYHGVKAMLRFFTILCVSDELLSVIGI